MLAYRHHFHAGSFADVFKHSLLVRLLLALGRKDKPFCFLDTHAGTGRYDLTHPWAEKLAEHREGISRIWGRDDLPREFTPYIEAVKAENPTDLLRFYPGSPRIARHFIRVGDRMILSELNRKDVAALGKRFARDRQVAVHHMDGFAALKAFLPPSERRGLVLVDASFDRAREFDRLVSGLTAAHERWASGTFAFWYPLMTPPEMRSFERAVKATAIPKILKTELSIHPRGWPMSLRGCGMLVVNPPWTFHGEASSMLKWLSAALATNQNGEAMVSWLTTE